MNKTIKQEWFGEWVLYRNNWTTITWFDPRSWFYWGWLFRFRYFRENHHGFISLRLLGLELSLSL